MSERVEGSGGGTPELAQLATRLEEIKSLLKEAVAGIHSVGTELRRIQGSAAARGRAGGGIRGAPKLDLSAAKNLSEGLYALWRDGRRGEVLEKLKDMSVLNLKSLCQVMSLGVDKRSTKQSLIDAILGVFSQRILLSSNVIVEEREVGSQSEQTEGVPTPSKPDR